MASHSCVRLSPKWRTPAEKASRMRSTGIVLETATRVISSGRRPARPAARSMRSPTLATFAAIVSGCSAMGGILTDSGPGRLRRAGSPARLTADMASRGTFIAIEGIDGSGKHTQAEWLGRAFAARGIPCVPFSFPRYGSSFGKLIASFLNGEFGSLEAIDAHLSALLYAGDRFEAKPELEAALAAGKTILADRYVASNLAHQTARVAAGAARQSSWHGCGSWNTASTGCPSRTWSSTCAWEPPRRSDSWGKKAPREYTALGHDLQESDLTHLERAAQVYDRLATEPNWVTIECLDAGAGRLKSVEEIHKAVLAAVDSRVLSCLAVS